MMPSDRQDPGMLGKTGRKWLTFSYAVLDSRLLFLPKDSLADYRPTPNS